MVVGLEGELSREQKRPWGTRTFRGHCAGRGTCEGGSGREFRRVGGEPGDRGVVEAREAENSSLKKLQMK